MHAFDCKPFKLAVKSNDFGRPFPDAYPLYISVQKSVTEYSLLSLFYLSSSNRRTAYLWVGTRPEYTIKFSPRFGFIPNSRPTSSRGFRRISPCKRACTGCPRNKRKSECFGFAKSRIRQIPNALSFYNSRRMNTYVPSYFNLRNVNRVRLDLCADLWSVNLSIRYYCRALKVNLGEGGH